MGDLEQPRLIGRSRPESTTLARDNRRRARAIVYGAVIAVLTVFYTVVVASAALLRKCDNDLAIVASVLIAAAIFETLRRRIQTFVDRRFKRSHYNAQRIVRSFADRVRDEVDPKPSPLDGSTLSQTMQPEAVGVWIKDHNQRPTTTAMPPGGSTPHIVNNVDDQYS